MFIINLQILLDEAHNVQGQHHNFEKYYYLSCISATLFLQYFTNIKLTEHTKKLCICISPNSLTFAVFVKQQAHEAYKALREEL